MKMEILQQRENNQSMVALIGEIKGKQRSAMIEIPKTRKSAILSYISDSFVDHNKVAKIVEGEPGKRERARNSEFREFFRHFSSCK